MKYLSILKYVLLIFGVALTAYAVASFNEADPTQTDGGVGALLVLSAVMIALTAALTVILPLFGLLQNPKSAGKSLIGVALVALVLVVSYAMADDTPITLASGNILENSGELKFADMALWSTYIMFAGLLCAMIVTEIYKAFK